LIEKYKGYGISIDGNGKFSAHKLDSQGGHCKQISKEYPTWNELKKSLDRMSKQKFGQSVWINPDHFNSDKFVKGKLSSAQESQYDGKTEFRVTHSKGSWIDKNGEQLIKDTPENVKIIEEIKSKSAEKKKLEKNIHELHETLENHTTKELMEDN